MGAFDTLTIASSSLGAHQVWLDALADNIANVNTATSTDQPAYQAKFAIFAPESGGGVQVAGFAGSSTEGRMVSDPDNPLADAQGYVKMPDIDMASQMSQLVMAQRGYQASVQVTKYAQDTYSSALQIGSR